MPNDAEIPVYMFAELFSFGLREGGSAWHTARYTLTHPILIPFGEVDIDTLLEVYLLMHGLVTRYLADNKPFFPPTPERT